MVQKVEKEALSPSQSQKQSKGFEGTESSAERCPQA